jgi:hypothetical protein
MTPEQIDYTVSVIVGSVEPAVKTFNSHEEYVQQRKL